MFNYRNLLWAGVATLIAASTGLAQDTDSLVNTEWNSPINNGTLSIHFQDAGKVLAIVGRGEGSGTYTQEGDKVNMTFSGGTFRGQIMGQTMNMTGVDNKGRQLSFQFTRQGSPANPAPVKNAPPVNAAPPGNPGPNDVILQKAKVDDLTYHCKAATILTPQGWKTNGGVTCDMSSGLPQAKTEMKVNDPQSLKQVEYFFLRPFTWSKNGGLTLPGGLGFIPNKRGTVQNGFEVQPMELDPQTFVKQYVLPRFRQGMQVTIVGVKTLPFASKGMSEESKATFKALGCRGSAGRVRVEYVLNGQAIEEDFYVELTEYTDISDGINTIIYGTNNFYAVRSAKGQLDGDTKLLVTVAESIQFDPRYKADLDQAVQIGLQTQANDQKAVMDRWQIARKGQEDCRKIQSEAYQNQQTAQDRSNQQFSNYLRGVDQYVVPGEYSAVTLPSGYNQVWGNGLGQYVLSNDPNVRQRLNGTNWQQLQVAPR